MSENSIRLTQYSHGAGCGCKISPKVLETILHSEQAKFVDPNLLVGNETRDDAAVYDLGNGTSVISTTDFFMPIVDNPFDFGRIAATNAISDIFAMGGKPIMAIAILGWPINKLSPEIAREVTETSGTGDRSDVPDEYRRRVLCQHRRRKSDDRRYGLWSAGPFERNVSGRRCAGAR